MIPQSSSSYSDTRPHYNLLDGLRGVAALLVVLYHVCEGFAFASKSSTITGINHGYLAVDFFFMLSGFVIAYAYNDRWNSTLRFGSFIRRRLIRLHPMVVFGAVTGAVAFLLQGSVQWDGSQVSLSRVLAALAFSLLLLPVVPGTSAEVRGNGEMFPLNGPSWSLFFEYLGNLLYALFLRRLSVRGLGFVALIFSLTLAFFTLSDWSGYGMLGVGWTLDVTNFTAGSLRLLTPFTIGMFISRTFRPRRVRGAFWLCTALLVAAFTVPYIPGIEGSAICWNGLYETLCILILFPLVIWLGAGGQTTDALSSRVCTFLGDISYPLYITHYPLMYLFYAWLIENRLYSFGETWPQVLLLVSCCILLAWTALKFYDNPLRRYLTRKFQ